MHLDVRHNPALLKLDLYCKGMRLTSRCLVEEDGGRRSCARGPGWGAASS